MLTIQNYVKAASLEEAYELNQKKSSRIIGGMLWLKMSHMRVQTAIDLSGLGLDFIEEDDKEFRSGAMATLRQLELHAGLNQYTGGSMRESLRHIVGVQFRNLATVGGSIFGRFGFSDVLTEFLALGASAELYKAGRVSLEEFAKMPADRDILVQIIVPKTKAANAYQSLRNTNTDFSVLTCAVSRDLDGTVCASVGARPARAVLVRDEEHILKDGITEESAAAFGEYVSGQIATGSNMRAGAEYRKHLAKVLTKRAVLQMEDRQNEN